MIKEYTPGLRVPTLSTNIDMINEYNQSELNGICECKYSLPLYVGVVKGYCFKCRKKLKDD